MPMESQSYLQMPPDSCVLWRYMDLPKFLALLQHASLHFCRADRFEDGWEGACNDADRKMEWFGQVSRYVKSNKYLHFVHCWHRGHHESAAMWKLYGHEGSNIAIRTSVGRLRKALSTSEHHILGGNVAYVDYSIAPESIGIGYAPFFRKRLSFAYENEFRLVVWKPHYSEDQKYLLPGNPDCNPVVLPISISVRDLVESVLVSPKSEEWYVELLQALVEKFELSPQIVSKSPLEIGPLW